MGEIYRSFMGRLVKAHGRAAADALIRDAVLLAWQGSGSPVDDGLSPGDLGNWQLTDGLVGLGKIAVSRPDALKLIVTTNFDPLIEVALQRVGVPTRRRIITADAPISDPGPRATNAVDIVYVHGFWHGAPTMHTPEQLMFSRPRLQAAIVNALKSHDVFVMGYGGWDDVITGALESLTLDDGAAAEVMWAFYESDPVVLQTRNRTLLSRVGRLIIEGLFHQYAGINCHQLLPELARKLDSGRAVETTALVGEIPSGWMLVDDALITGARGLHSDQDLRAYFDGRSPDWAVASSSVVPSMAVVDQLCEPLLDWRSERPLWQFVLAASGDGKSTALMQAACRLAASGWRVLWRPHPGASLNPHEFLCLADDVPTAIVIDDADNCVDELRELADKMQRRNSLHLIAASRLADWRYANGEVEDFEQVEGRTISIGSLSRREGREVIDAWASVPQGLGQLAQVDPGEQRLERLLSAVASDRRSNGSLLGGLFRLRYDREGLDAHVNSMLDALERQGIEGSHVSLLKAFIYVSAIEVAGLDGIDRRLWADLLGIDVRFLRRTVEYRLGTEAATARAGGLVQVRHPELANSAIRLLLARDRGVELGDVYADIVASAISLGRQFDLRNYSRIVHLSTQLPQSLVSVGYLRDKAFAIALKAARASIEAEPALLVYQTDLGSLLRKAHKTKEAIELYGLVDEQVRNFRDWRRAAPGFYFDYSLAFSDASDPYSALLCIAAAWKFEAGSISRADSGKYFVQMTRFFLQAYEETMSDRARLALAGTARLADLAMISAQDHALCVANAAAGKAPARSGLSASQAYELVDKAILLLTRDRGSQTLPGYQTGELQRKTSHLLALV
ncbi:SIR2 family protein [Nostocoides sp. HKS02]|uniref:P-loop NTPase n=1 Tax=Nostocoides sp. HKS02 TaxID=1813880 RepID=UPI0018A8547E|nr:SIR2 family protein [Tetrasphaera sp. HKS02]